METQGFYKKEKDNLLYAQNSVLNSEYQLFKELKDEYNYPIDGWYWFDSEDDVYVFFSIEKPLDYSSGFIF